MGVMPRFPMPVFGKKASKTARKEDISTEERRRPPPNGFPKIDLYIIQADEDSDSETGFSPRSTTTSVDSQRPHYPAETDSSSSWD